jgi:hypothetical protein
MRLVHLFIFFSCVTTTLVAQPTINMYQRVYMIQTATSRGTAFAVDIDDREYWITARHILTGAKKPPYGNVKEKTVTINIHDADGSKDRWVPHTFIVLQPPEDVDIVVLVPQTPLTSNLLASPQLSSNIMLGESCGFMGFPYGGGWRMKTDAGTFWAPFTKRCSISGSDLDTRLFILDGINNKGFSGGPVFVGTGEKLKVMAVVSGYHTEPTDVIKGKATPETDPKDTVELNSGFILAYDIGIVLDLVKKSPIGPLKQRKQQTLKGTP